MSHESDTNLESESGDGPWEGSFGDDDNADDYGYGHDGQPRPVGEDSVFVPQIVQVVGDSAPPPPKRQSQRRGIPWGSCGWELAVITRHGVVVGCGALCKDHRNPDDINDCKKSVIIGESGLTFDDLRLRLKRWLIAGQAQ